MEKYVKADIGIIRLGGKTFVECRLSHRVNADLAASIKGCLQKEFAATDCFFNPQLSVIDAVGIFRVDGLVAHPEGFLKFKTNKNKKEVR